MVLLISWKSSASTYFCRLQFELKRLYLSVILRCGGALGCQLMRPINKCGPTSGSLDPLSCKWIFSNSKLHHQPNHGIEITTYVLVSCKCNRSFSFKSLNSPSSPMRRDSNCVFSVLTLSLKPIYQLHCFKKGWDVRSIWVSSSLTTRSTSHQSSLQGDLRLVKALLRSFSSSLNRDWSSLLDVDN